MTHPYGNVSVLKMYCTVLGQVPHWRAFESKSIESETQSLSDLLRGYRDRKLELQTEHSCSERMHLYQDSSKDSPQAHHQWRMASVLTNTTDSLVQTIRYLMRTSGVGLSPRVGLAAGRSKAIKEAGLVERKVYFGCQQLEGRGDTCPKADSPSPTHWQSGGRKLL